MYAGEYVFAQVMDFLPLPRWAFSRRILARARGAPIQRRRSARPTHIQVVSRATRDQTDPTRSSRLGGASPISFSRYSALGRPPRRRARAGFKQ